MQKKWKYLLYGLIAVFLAIQFIPANRVNPAADPALEITAPTEVKAILKASCYDCHSNNTRWPFYSYIAPVSWLVAGDVHEGRGHLNFSEWNMLHPQQMKKKKEEIAEEVTEGEMPLSIYLILHPSAKLNDRQKQTLTNWAGAEEEEGR